MKIISTKVLANGRIRSVVECSADETILSVSEKVMMKLGYPMDDIVPAHVIGDATPVTWCPISQRWVE